MSEAFILRAMMKSSAVIVKDGAMGTQSYSAYPRGDKRKRPVCFVPADILQRFVADGLCVETKRGFEVVESAVKRARGGHSAQHRDMAPEVMTDEHGRFRVAQINRRTRAPLERLMRRKTSTGDGILSSAEIEAGYRLARDYERSTLSVSVTQKYDNIGGSSGHARGPEDASLAAIDARARYLDALEILGPGLDRVVSGICCKQKDMMHIERDEGFARDTGLSVLKLGLQRLAQHYGTIAGVSPARR